MIAGVHVSFLIVGFSFFICLSQAVEPIEPIHPASSPGQERLMRRRFLLAPLLFAAGCGTTADSVPSLIEQQILSVAPTRVESITPATEPAVMTAPSDLAGLWQLALSHNPALREAAAEVEMARGRLMQAGKYPNPKLSYLGDQIGSSVASKGNQSVEISQEIVTGGKRPLDLASASRGLDAATTGLLGHKLEALSRLRRAYYDYQSLAYARQVNREVVEALENGVEMTRKLVEEAKTRPRTDLLRLQALLEQAHINTARAETNVTAAWKQVAVETGLPELPPPPTLPALPSVVPAWSAAAVTHRVLAANTDVSLTALEADRARLEYERARAEAVPNVTVGAGYTRAFVEETAGLALLVETPIPIWDRKEGLIHEMRARWARAQAAERSTMDRLSRDVAEAFGRYEGAQIQAERLTTLVLPKLEESLKLVRAGYEAGAKDATFLEVQIAVEALNEGRGRLAEARRELWRAIADLQGLMQLDLGEEFALH
jgi:cobalt-zinc-cadmium efflux system outer membrane protein